jgi:glycerol-1-phosphate dehydrogenase [NAD(P)+]
MLQYEECTLAMNPTTEAVRRIRSVYPSLSDRTVTEHVLVGRGVLASAGEICSQLLDTQVLLVADPETYAAAGQTTAESLRNAGLTVDLHLLDEHPVATPMEAEKVVSHAVAIADVENPASLVAVGAGTVNDITKTAATSLNRPYVSVGTALSMNGYTSAISALLDGGVKRTVPATPPVAVLIDLDICAAAPMNMTLAGFGDMLSKPFSEADWRLSHAIDDVPWHAAPGDLLASVYPSMIAAAHDIGRCEAEALSSLAHAVLLSGMAMAFAGVSSPASGGEHLISHYWDMGQYAKGQHPFALHGTQVGVACCLIERLHHQVSQLTKYDLQLDEALRAWPTTSVDARKRVESRHLQMPADVRERIVTEALKKWRPLDEQRKRLERAQCRWDTISDRWREALLPLGTVSRALIDVGGAIRPVEVHPSLSNELADWLHVRDMRSRYTVLDFASEIGLTVGLNPVT